MFFSIFANAQTAWERPYGGSYYPFLNDVVQTPAWRNLQPNYKCKLNIPVSQIQQSNIANCTTIGGMLSGN